MKVVHAAIGFGVVVLLAAFSGRAFAQSEEQVRSAIDRGIAYLREEQLQDGSWFYESHEVGITALATLTLIENGAPLNDSAVRRGTAFVREQVENEFSTYDVSLTILLLSRIGDRRDRTRIRQLAARIQEGQLTTGGWTYSLDPDNANIYGDNSNTQFAVLGLWAGSRIGVDVDDTLSRVEERIRDSQVENGDWPYTIAEDAAVVVQGSGSMTCALLFALAVCEASDLRRAIDSQSQESDAETGRSRRGRGREARSLLDDDQFRLGLERVGDHAAGIQDATAPYFLWSMERLGVLLGLAEFGETDWYEQGARALLATQADTGSWGGETLGGSIANTCFALLFLRKANLGSDITRLLSGQPELEFCISSREQRPRYETLDEAIAEAEDGETIQIDGAGPYVLSHVVIDRELTLQAGFGYAPVLTFEVGRRPDGLRRDPRQDQDARYMIIVRGGVLTLEGLELLMEPPATADETPWAVVHVEDGVLNVLNCDFTTSGRTPSAAILLSAEEPLVLRNALFVGFDPAIDVVAQTEHTVIAYNSTIYGPTGIRVTSADGAEDAACTMQIQECSAQAEELLDLGRMNGPVEIESISNVMRLDWISADLLPPSGMPQRTWYGEGNLYDVRNWVGQSGRAIGDVRSLSSWRRYWDTEEEGSVAATAPFSVYRPLGNYSQSVSPQDWYIEYEELARTFGRGEVQVGTDVFLVGAGQAFSQFRESIDYEEWVGE